MSKQVKNIQKKSFNIEVPKTFKIGDPLYLYENVDKKMTTSLSFARRKDWVGSLTVFEDEVIDEDNFTYKDLYVKVYLAPNETMLKTYEEDMCYKGQTEKQKSLGVDTAEYVIETSKGYETIKTGADGWWGSTIEIKSSKESVNIPK